NIKNEDRKLVEEFSCKFASLNLDDKKKVFYSFLEKKGIKVTDETKKNLETRLATSADLILKYSSEYKKYSEADAKRTFATILERQSTATQINSEVSNSQPAERQATKDNNSSSSRSATSKSYPWLDILMPNPTNQKITNEELTKIFNNFMITTSKEELDKYKTQKLNQQQIQQLKILEEFGKHFKKLSFKDKTDYFFQALEYKGYKLTDEKREVLKDLSEIHNIYSQETSDKNKQQNTSSPSPTQSSGSAIRQSSSTNSTQNNLQGRSPSQPISASHSRSSDYLTEFMKKYKNDFDMVLLDMPDKNRHEDASQLTGFYRTNIGEILMNINSKDNSTKNLTGEEMIFKLFDRKTNINGLNLDDIGDAIKDESQRLQVILKKQEQAGINIGSKAKSLLEKAVQDVSGVQSSSGTQAYSIRSNQGTSVGNIPKRDPYYWRESIKSSRASRSRTI
ncbi:MAG: hypothetical protein RL769_767, partial [Pseudomonadota bacterium]